jgi:hypothetical protein
VAIKDDDDTLIAGADGGEDLDETDNNQDITDKLVEIAEQDETDHAIREAGGKVVKIQEVQQFDIPTQESEVKVEPGVKEPQAPLPDGAPVTRSLRSNCIRFKNNSYVLAMKGQKYHMYMFQ